MNRHQLRKTLCHALHGKDFLRRALQAVASIEHPDMQAATPKIHEILREVTDFADGLEIAICIEANRCQDEPRRGGKQAPGH